MTLEHYWILSLLCAHAFSLEKEEMDAILVELSNQAGSGYSLHEVNTLIAIQGLYERQGWDHKRSAKTPSWMSASPYISALKKTEDSSFFSRLWGKSQVSAEPIASGKAIQLKRRLGLQPT